MLSTDAENNPFTDFSGDGIAQRMIHEGFDENHIGFV